MKHRILILISSMTLILGLGIPAAFGSIVGGAPPAGTSTVGAPQVQSPGVIPDYSDVDNQFIYDWQDGNCVTSVYSFGNNPATDSACNPPRQATTMSLLYVGTVTDSGGQCWPFTCGNGLNAKFAGYGVYWLAQPSSNTRCAFLNGQSVEFGVGYCSGSAWQSGTDWVAGFAPNGANGWYSLVNVVNSDAYGQSMTLQAWGSGYQDSVNYWGRGNQNWQSWKNVTIPTGT